MSVPQKTIPQKTAPKRQVPAIVIFLGFLLGAFLLYRLVLFLSKVFVYAGYNSSLFMDSLLQMPGFPPIMNWAILGLLIGVLVGIVVAVKKYKLSRLLILYPVGGVVLFIGLLAFVNHPTRQEGVLDLPAEATTEYGVPPVRTAVPQYYYRVLTDAKAHTLPSVRQPVAFVLKRGVEVKVVQRGFQENHVEWMKIDYMGQTGYVSSKVLVYNRSVFE